MPIFFMFKNLGVSGSALAYALPFFLFYRRKNSNIININKKNIYR